MKRYILIIAAAFFALMSCSKDVTSPSDETGEGTYFTEGQQVTLTCGTQHTKVNGTENTDKGIDFIWEDGDKIKVSIGTASSEFTLISGVGKTATFTGQMPASGSTFDVQYPVTDPDLTSQTYIAGALPHDKMKFAKTGCTLGSAIALEAQYSALRLNLYGWDRQVNSITVTNTTASPNVPYTLTCSDPVKVGSTSEDATPFLLVMPIGSYNFKASVTSSDTGEGSVLPDYIDEKNKGILITTGTMETTSAKEFTKDNVLNLSARAITQILAPVNCGYDADHTYGLLYQWGRKVGSGFNTTEGMQTATAATYTDGFNKNPDDTKFYYQEVEPCDWYTNTEAKQLSAWPMKSGDAGYVAGKIANPCPTGWRVPTNTELTALIANKSGWTTHTVSGVTQSGRWFSGSITYSESAPRVFLPAAGGRRYQSGEPISRDETGSYWSSSVDDFKARYLYLNDSDSKTNMYSDMRAYGLAVRCVYDPNLTSGDFSVSDTKKVKFSKGNLYYTGSEFKFEDTQYAYTASYDANHVCRFCWAKNSTDLSVDIAAAISSNTLSYATNDVFFTNATQTTPRTDFTVADQTGVWRTLSKDEWDYLLSTRDFNGVKGEGKSYQRATINSDGTGVYGLIIYPDNYKSQSGATSYTTDEWTMMETDGCIFLPAAGSRVNSELQTVGAYGVYWSSTPSGSNTTWAYYFLFNNISFTPADQRNRNYGNSVRLVRDVN